MAKTLEELQQEYDNYKTTQDKLVKEKDSKIKELELKLHDSELKVATLNELRLSQSTNQGNNNKRLMEDFE